MPTSEVRATQNGISAAQKDLSGRWSGLLFLLCASGLAVRLWHLTSKPFWFDECFSVELARLNWGSFLRVLWWREANMSLYYFLLRGWLHFGQTEFFIRSFSALIGAVTIPAIYWLAKLLYDRRVAIVSAGLFAFNAYNVRYSQEARSYSLFVLLATLSSGFLILCLREPKRRALAGYIVTSILAVYAHFYALLLLAAQWLMLRWARPGGADKSISASSGNLRRAWRLIALGLFPLLIFVAKTGAGPIHWIHRPGFHDLLVFWQQISGGSGWMLPLILLAACAAATAPVRKNLLARDGVWDDWRCQFLLAWLLFPVLLTVFLSFLRPVFLVRFLIFCQPAMIVLAAAGLVRIRRTWLLIPVLSAILLFSLQGIFFVYAHDYDDQRDGTGAAVDFILDHSAPGDGIIFHIAEARVPYEFFRSERAGQNTASKSYAGQLGPEILFPHEGNGLDYSDFKAKVVPEILESEISRHSRVWVMFLYNEAGGAKRTTVLLQRMLPQQLPREQCWEFPKVQVCLYSRE